MQHGFAIDQRTCIGRHACTVACKTEHEVPVGQFRIWEYVEKGEFPATTREFGVLRCNHCTDAPCVKICPTKALFKRDDGIVNFDRDRCIGCKSCMQGCPYDAIYIDEDIEPACVVVCPTHSIWVGDLDDPTSGISKLINNNPTSVRAPEQNTGPSVFYLGADRAVLEPLDAPVDKTYICSQPDAHRAEVSADLHGDSATQARTTYNTAHPRPWGWRVTTNQIDGVWHMRQNQGVRPFQSTDPDSERIFWDDPGVHQNLTFPVQPDPWSGMHCWLQKVRVEPAHEGDEYADVVVDTRKSREVYAEWLDKTGPPLALTVSGDRSS